MKHTAWFLVPTLTLALAGAAMAGGQKCEEARAKQASYAASRCAQDAEGCLSTLAAKLATRGWVGVETEKNEHGKAVVIRVASGSPAAKAGFQRGDVLVALNGVELTEANRDALRAMKSAMTPGADVEYTVNRRSGQQHLVVTLDEVPREILAQWVGEHMLDQHAYADTAAP